MGIAAEKDKHGDATSVEALAQVGNPRAPEPLFTAKMQRDHLDAALKNWDVDSEPDEGDTETVPIEQIPSRRAAEVSTPWTEQSPRPARLWDALLVNKRATFIKSALALLVALVLGWWPVQRLLTTTSAQAVTNGRVVTVRTPISGDVHALAAQLEVGTTVKSGDELMMIENPRSDRSNLDNLKRNVEQLTTSLAVLQAKEAVLKDHHTALLAQSERYRTGRIEILEKQLSEIDAQIAAAEARHKEFIQAVDRGRTLSAQGVVLQAYVDKAVRDEGVAAETIHQLEERRKVAEVSLASARQGTFVTDGYNDTPQSAQGTLEVELQLADVQVRLAGTAKELEAARQDLAREQKRDQDLSTAVIRASVSGRVWEIMTAPGEHVNAGQTLMRLLDCSNAMVTANVSERVFQKLSIGQHAAFQPADGGDVVQGWIVDLNGLAAVASNDAIQSNLLSGQPYHVTLKFPDLARRSQCQISRAGLVTFDTSNRVAPVDMQVGDAR